MFNCTQGGDDIRTSVIKQLKIRVQGGADRKWLALCFDKN